jgi:hypothetical protein
LAFGFRRGFLLLVVCLPIAQSWRFCPSLWPLSLARQRLASCLGRAGAAGAAPANKKKFRPRAIETSKFFKTYF